MRHVTGPACPGRTSITRFCMSVIGSFGSRSDPFFVLVPARGGPISGVTYVSAFLPVVLCVFPRARLLDFSTAWFVRVFAFVSYWYKLKILREVQGGRGGVQGA